MNKFKGTQETSELMEHDFNESEIWEKEINGDWFEVRKLPSSRWANVWLLMLNCKPIGDSVHFKTIVRKLNRWIEKRS